MNQTLLINEIFHSIQGESTWAGKPCVFVRLTGCNLRCRYCDTEYAFYEGKKQSLEKIIEQVCSYKTPLVEITGGEPLLQPNVHPLMKALCDLGKQVLVETSGACDISLCDPRVIRIMDIKTPGSGEVEKNLWANIIHLLPQDEIKFVLTCRQDYEFARDTIRTHDLAKRVHAVLLSGVNVIRPGAEIPGTNNPTFTLADLAKWILEDQLPVRMQTQLHKLIWDPNARGV